MAVAAAFAVPGAPGRRFVFYARNAACFKRPSDGGVAAVGDSITAGTSEPDWGFLGRRSWFDQMVCDGTPPYSYNAAIPNYTTEQVAGRLSAAIAHHPRVVVILTGTNDVLHRLSLPHAAALIDAMVRRLRRNHIGAVMATVPPFNANPVGAVQLNRLLRQVAARERVPLIDFHSVLAGPDGRYQPALTIGGIHPSVAGAKAMARVAEPVVQRALAAR